MLVSIITPIYKSQDYIEACARSLFEQTYRDIEYIFVDDAGGDNSIPILEKIIKDYPQRHDQVKIIHHDNNRGSAMARESGMMAAHGHYIIHVDSDDTVSPLFIEHLVKAVIENDADVSICNIATTNKTSAKFAINQVECDNPSDYVASVLAGTVHASLCNKLFRRSIFIEKNIHFLDNINMYDDMSVVFRAFYYCKNVVIVDEELYFYNRNNRNSITHKTRKRTEVVSAIALSKLVEDFFSDKQVTAAIINGIVQLKNAIAGMLINHVPIKEYRDELKGLEPFEMRIFIHQNNLPLHYKVALMLYNCKLFPVIFLQRKLVVKMSNLYYKTQLN